MLLGYDHGFITWDSGARGCIPITSRPRSAWASAYDMAQPYNVYCGLQDNGSKMGPSSMKNGGNIPFEAWTNVGGGDGQFNIVDLQTDRYLYNGSQFGALGRTDLVTGETKGYNGAGRGSGAGQFDGKDIRWNWNAPIVVSPHNGDTVYHAANMVLKSTDKGETWSAIRGHLTANDPATRGGTGNISYATTTAFDESPTVPGVLWAGTDDGNVQVTKMAARPGRTCATRFRVIPATGSAASSRRMRARARPT